MDRTFRRPLTASQYAAYAGQVDVGFRFVVNSPVSITDAQALLQQRANLLPTISGLEPYATLR